jgi:adenosylcobinamide kinase/adenosylcobinamide-phosphate guanylyltransferase
MSIARHYFVLGGARSGKSLFAEKLTLNLAPSCSYLATARIWDDEMRDRINEHKVRRGDEWLGFEEPIELAHQLKILNDQKRPVLVDCLTMWVTNLMMEEQDIEAASDELIDVLKTLSVPVVFVSNEVGQGIVPDNKMAREFIDHTGLLHQKISQAVDEVYFLTAGLPSKLKG